MHATVRAQADALRARIRKTSLWKYQHTETTETFVKTGHTELIHQSDDMSIQPCPRAETTRDGINAEAGPWIGATGINKNLPHSSTAALASLLYPKA